MILFLWLISIALPAKATEKTPLNGAVAVVNGSVITQDALDREIRRNYRAKSKKPPAKVPSTTKKKLIEHLIVQELLYQESQKSGITVDKAAVNERFEIIKNRFKSDAEFEMRLEQEKLTKAGLKLQIERKIAVDTFYDIKIKKLNEKITVSDDEMKKLYDNHPELNTKTERIRFSAIQTESLKTIRLSQKYLEEGWDFMKVARAKFSPQDRRIFSGRLSDSKYYTREELTRSRYILTSKSLLDTAFALKAGEVSDIVKTKSKGVYFYSLIKVDDKKPETKVNYADVKDKIKKALRKQKLQAEYSSYIYKIFKTSKVKVIAEFSIIK